MFGCPSCSTYTNVLLTGCISCGLALGSRLRGRGNAALRENLIQGAAAIQALASELVFRYRGGLPGLPADNNVLLSVDAEEELVLARSGANSPMATIHPWELLAVIPVTGAPAWGNRALHGVGIRLVLVQSGDVVHVELGNQRGMWKRIGYFNFYKVLAEAIGFWAATGALIRMHDLGAERYLQEVRALLGQVSRPSTSWYFS